MQALINGLQIAFTDEGQGPPLVFIHGFPLNRQAWTKQVEGLQATYRVIAPDLRGLGESQGTAGTVAMSQFAEDIHGLVEHLNLGPIVLIGHSMGGYIALAFAKAYPAALRGLVLVATKAGADFPEVAEGRRATAEKVRIEGISVVLKAMAPKMLSAKNLDPTMAAAVLEFMGHSKPEGVISALLGMAERPDATAWLADLRMPTLVVTGLNDILIPPHESEDLTNAIQGSQLKLIPKAGHLVAYEQGEAFNAALRAWLP